MNTKTIVPAAEVANEVRPIKELLSRYKVIFNTVWSHRKELAGPARMADEIAFLPAALSLQETPVHPAPRLAAYVLMALFAIALTWSIFGEIDIVAVAPGRIIVSDRTKVIQPLETSVVKSVLVKDGERVTMGQVLVELDSTMVSADKANLQELRKSAISEQQRTAALLQLLQGASSLEKVQANLSTGDRVQLVANWHEIKVKLGKFDADTHLRQAGIETVKSVIAKLEATVPMAQSREADFKRLVEQGYISEHASQDKTRERVELERDLITQRARLVEAQSALRESEQSKAAYIAELIRALSDQNSLATTKHGQLDADHRKADQRAMLTLLRAPVTGIVQQLTIHTPGGIVTSAQPLMVVVPDSTAVTAEVFVANQDIGFVNSGQSVAIKLETFSYTKYGTIDAQVDNVAADAVTDDKRGSFYPATLSLSQKDMLIDGKRIPLSPGMNVVAEIKTGKRRIIEYLLSPLQRLGSESLKER